MRTRAAVVCVVLGAMGCAGNEATVVDVDSGVVSDVPSDRGAAMDMGDAGSALDGDIVIDDGGPVDERCGAELHNVCSGQCVDLQTSLLHCGACDRRCMAPQNGRATCTAGMCGFICDSSYSVCGSACVNLQSDSANCGACGSPCAAGLSCMDGMCRCSGGGARCGSTCVDTQMDNNHCGSCENACPPGQLCRGGMCGCTAPGLMRCGSACADTQTDVNHCGRCGNRCTTDVAGATPACVAGECIVRCPAGQRWTGRDCVTITTPRPVGPLTPFVVSTLRPTLRWDFGTGNDGARVEICSNRDCTGAPVQTFDAAGSSGRVLTALMPRRPYWWRLYGRAGDATGTMPSVTWMFQTPARDLGTDTTLTSTRRDINGDGYDDLVIGSFSNHVEVLLGSATGLRTGMADRLVFENTEAGFGYSNALGDVNGDGLADLVAASRSNVYVYHGSMTAPYLPSSPSSTINIVASAGATKSVETLVGVGDVNSDGYDDIVAGEWNTRVIVASGTGVGIDLASVIAVTPRLSGSSLTWAYFVPDLDGNGFSEMVISNLCHPTACGMGSTGQSWLFAGTRTGLATMTATPSGIGTGLPATNANFGYDVEGNDWDGDGYGDIFVGSGSVGAALYRGRSALPPLRSSTLTGLSRHALASGDFDLDGTPELAVSIGVSSAPDAVEIYRGGVGTPRTIMGTDSGDFGGWLSAADHNGDGVLDLAVGAVNAIARRGRVYVFPGARGTGVASMASHVIDPVGTGVTQFAYIR